MDDFLEHCPAPAKLNLFLHVTGRRADGYHTLQSLFQLIDLGDRLSFRRRTDSAIVRVTDVPGVPPETDLVVRAARLLQQEARRLGRTAAGVDIVIEKNIPMGGGLGGGSSDAATTLLALNRLWQLGCTRQRLMKLGLTLGADVPFFIFGHNAFAEGIGEQLVSVDTPQRWFAVIHPGINVATATVFTAAELTRDTKPIKISDFSALVDGFGHNDLEPVAAARFAPVAQALAWIGKSGAAGRLGAARMSGSGACVFGVYGSEERARQAVCGLPAGWTGWVCSGLAHHPLLDWATDGPAQ